MKTLPVSAQMKPFASADGDHLFVVGGSRIYDVDAATAEAIGRALTHDDSLLLPQGIGTLLEGRFASAPARSDAPPVTALSLNIAQSCNMGCGYCYAEQGSFGGAKKRVMDSDVARQSVDRLLEWTPRGARAVIAFMGGEPLLNRNLLHDITRYAVAAARDAERTVAFSLTTNGTLLTDDDAALFHAHPFSVTVSIDGPPEVQDRQRPMLAGAPSSVRLSRGLEKLLERRPRELTGRMTVTPQTGPLLPVLRHVLSLGFDSAGFSPVLAAPDPRSELHGEAQLRFADEMILCGRYALAEMLGGRRCAFSNLEAALNELHRGAARAHPCGAGAGYLSVDADGDLFACHRLVGDERFAFGGLADGIDETARAVHLETRSVDRQEPCRTCWARYLCGGGCHHEVANRGRENCDYIRRWLEFSLEAYVTLSRARPEVFAWTPPPRSRTADAGLEAQ